jgi:hypothetical protein
MVLYNGLRSAMPLSERSGERKANKLIAQGSALGIMAQEKPRPTGAKAFALTARQYT